MSFNPPEQMPPVNLPVLKEVHHVPGETESETAAFEAETAGLFHVLERGRFHKLDYETQEMLLNNFFEPYIVGERSFSECLKNPETAPRALELVRRIYAQCGFATFDGKTIDDRKERSSHRDSTDFSPDVLSESIVASLDDLGSALKRTDLNEKALRRLRNNIFYAVSEAQNTGNSQTRYRIDEWLDHHFDELESIDPFFYDDSDGSEDHMSLYARGNFFLHSENEMLAKKLLDSLMRLRRPGQESDISQEVDQDVIKPILGQIKPMASAFVWRKEQLARGIAGQYGLDANIIGRWKAARVKIGDYDRESYWENLQAVTALEAQRPGSAQALYKEYGIANLARYEQGMLLHQLDIADKDVRYGIIAYSEADHNGALFQTKEQLYDVSLQLRAGGLETRIVEAGSQRELARRLLWLHKKYSPAGNKFSFAIGGGHGTEDSVELGQHKTPPPPFPNSEQSVEEQSRATTNWLKTADRGEFKTEELIAGEGINRALQEWFEQNAPKVLISCSTGVEGGVGETLSVRSGGEVTAPKQKAYGIEKISVAFDDAGKPLFSVQYGKTETAQYIGGKSRR